MYAQSREVTTHESKLSCSGIKPLTHESKISIVLATNNPLVQKLILLQDFLHDCSNWSASFFAQTFAYEYTPPSVCKIQI